MEPSQSAGNFAKKTDNMTHPIPRPVFAGDYNYDGKYGIEDLNILVKLVGEISNELDMTGDSVIDVQDLRMLIENRIRTKMGDINLDGKVDITDIIQLSNNWFFFNPNAGWQHGDFNGDNIVDNIDLLFLLSQ